MLPLLLSYCSGMYHKNCRHTIGATSACWRHLRVQVCRSVPGSLTVHAKFVQQFVCINVDYQITKRVYSGHPGPTLLWSFLETYHSRPSVSQLTSDEECTDIL